jgi:hypothetical protein
VPKGSSFYIGRTNSRHSVAWVGVICKILENCFWHIFSGGGGGKLGNYQVATLGAIGCVKFNRCWKCAIEQGCLNDIGCMIAQGCVIVLGCVNTSGIDNFAREETALADMKL